MSLEDYFSELDNEISREAEPLAALLILEIEKYMNAYFEKHDDAADCLLFAQEALAKACAHTICLWQGYSTRADDCIRILERIQELVAQSPLENPSRSIFEDYKPWRRGR